MKVHPFSSTGRSSVVLGKESYYGGDFIVAHVKLDKDALKNVVPRIFEPDGEALFSLREFVTVMGDRTDLLYEEPMLTQYNESAIGVKVRYDGGVYQYYPFMWVDKEFAVVRGWLNGYPKKMANIQLTRFHPLLPQISEPKPGVVVGGYVTRGSGLLFKIKVTLREKVEKPPTFGPTLLIRDYPAEGEGETSVLELVRLDLQDLKVTDVWRGDVEIEIGKGINDEVDNFKVTEKLGGYYYKIGFRIPGTKLIKKLSESELF
ncbi:MULTISPECIES: acetoacetate decarboxylase family protein [Metallosphaera]|uniref:Acetoacetate decarboxylase n=1 Tax=Metallosphaera prunae TaxID=47304 RepID=A0A4D8S117_METPR|nr:MULTISPECIES: acetoacetate decarboxylase family protein [Metallosphaera]QCO29119.1 acetoacetate decarboxylase [Metallosphaera prunae]BBL47299.1 acetoacetate decarboxylase [Metallosphaera sedula]